MDSKYDLTTAEGREKAMKDAARRETANTAIATASVAIPAVGIARLVVTGLREILSQKDIQEAQRETAEMLLKAGKENGLDTLEFDIDNKVGLGFGANFDGIPLKASIGSKGKMTVKAKYK